jgi:uncharacterized protein YbbC (DUF1343 family)
MGFRTPCRARDDRVGLLRTGTDDSATAKVRTGLDRLAAGEGPDLRGQRVAALCHAASVTSNLRHITDVLALASVELTSLLGPEHGVWGAAQDMEAVADETPDMTPVYSLYGEEVSSLSPRPEMLHGAEVLVCDLQDVGSRYYTYVWTVVLAVEVALMAGVRVLVLDRPNPLGGLDEWVEGGSIAPGQDSFVGLHPVATRHGLTVGEMCRMAVEERGRVDPRGLNVLACSGWSRSMLFPETGLPWVLPSPNMPTFETALVYPGQCLFEGTNLSEGRGHTRPFETFGAPWVDGARLARAIPTEDTPGLLLRPVRFRPMYQKHAGRDCGGLQLHVKTPGRVRSLRTAWALLGALWAQSPGAMKWRTEPYEFVSDRPAIDLLAGGPWLRQAIEAGASTSELMYVCEPDRQAFLRRRRPFLLYEDA